jgi:hypothetical protein
MGFGIVIEEKAEEYEVSRDASKKFVVEEKDQETDK